MPVGLADIFGVEHDEKVVLSVCAVPDGEGWKLLHGTLLVVPDACAAVSWSRWHREHVDRRTPALEALPGALATSGEGWLMGRVVTDIAHGDRLLVQLTESLDTAATGGTTIGLDAIGDIPALTATLQSPQAIIHALPGTDAPTAPLLAGLGRPAQALLWAGESSGRFPLPQSIDVVGETSFMPSLDLTGIHVATEGWPETQAGLLVGRAERRAWLRQARGDGLFESFLVDLEWDPARISIPDLEVEYEELLEGELVLSTRMRLEDLDTSAVEDIGLCTITLPTLGRSVTHSTSLYTVDGELLDRSGPHHLLEHLQLNIAANGHELKPIVIGRSDPPPGLDERLDRAEAIANELQGTIRNAVQARMIADRQRAVDRLTSLLKTARGELLVLDRYFGQSGEDWHLLDDVPVAVRVLCGKLEKDHVPTIGPHVSARFRPKAALHERIYLWDGGGLAVGGSPTTFGQGPVRMTRLRRPEVDEWRVIFEAEWGSPLYREVDRA